MDEVASLYPCIDNASTTLASGRSGV